MNRNHLVILAVAVSAFSSGILYSSHSPHSNVEMAETGTGNANIVAAAENSNTGALGKVEVEVVPGSGNVLVETNPFIQADTQLSATKAKEVAEEYTGKSLENHDLIYRIEMDSRVVGGPSAGAAMTLATIAAITDQEVREDAVVTGTITESGRIGRVGEIPVKAYTAGQSNISDFYVPKGQSVKINYERVLETERRGFLVYRDVEYRPQKFNISTYTQENFGMKTEEVENIHEAAERMLS